MLRAKMVATSSRRSSADILSELAGSSRWYIGTLHHRGDEGHAAVRGRSMCSGWRRALNRPLLDTYARE